MRGVRSRLGAAGRWALAAVFALALLSGCTVFADLPTPDPNAGGGVQQAGPDDAGGGIAPPPAGAPAAGSPTEAAPLPEVTIEPVQPAPEGSGGGLAGSGDPQVAAPQGIAVAGSPMAVGDSIQRGALTLTLDEAAAAADGLTIRYTIAGLPDGYEPLLEQAEPYLRLPDGTVLRAAGGSGSGIPGGETVEYFFPAPSAAPASAALLLTHAYAGAPETWEIPVRFEP
jgi:hypothetical protein